MAMGICEILKVGVLYRGGIFPAEIKTIFGVFGLRNVVVLREEGAWDGRFWQILSLLPRFFSSISVGW